MRGVDILEIRAKALGVPVGTLMPSMAPKTPQSKLWAKEERDKRANRLFAELELRGLPKFEREFYWHPTRKFRSDGAYPDYKVLVEYQGGGGDKAHRNAMGYHKDRKRSNEAQALGYIILEIDPINKDFDAIAELVKSALKSRGWTE